MVSHTIPTAELIASSRAPLKSHTLAPHSNNGYTHRIGNICWAIPQFLLRCQRVARQRRELNSLNNDLLMDIGLKKEDAIIESRRGWFDLPSQQ